MTASLPRPRRPLAVRNAHPRLVVPRAALRRTFELLDSDFRLLAGDRPYLSSPPPSRRSRATASVGTSPCPPGELSLVFLTDAALARLHGDFLDDPTPTDVITFAGHPAAGLAGEICVSVDTAAAYARAHRREFAAELTLYLVHGWLHLAGYDDLQPARKRRMRVAEKRALALLHQARAVPPFRLRPG